MNFKFKVKGFEAKMKGEGNIKVDEIEVSYEDVKLTEIPAIIKEVRKSIVELKDAFEEPRVEQHDLYVQTHVAPAFSTGFPFFGGCQEPHPEEGMGEDTDGDTSFDSAPKEKAKNE